MMARGRIYNVIATEEELEKVNERNMELWRGWEMYLKTASKSLGTIKNYKSDVVNFFFGWLMKYRDNKFFGDIVPKDILLFQNYIMEDLGLNNNRVRRIKDSLSSFSNYVVEFEDIDGFENIIRVVPSPKRIYRLQEPTIFTDEDIKTLFEGMIHNYYYQDACALAMILYGGLRKTDIVKIKADWFDKYDIEGDLYKSPEMITTKGDKEVFVYILKKECDRWLYLWKKERKKLMKKQIFTPSGEEYLFIHRHDGRWRQMSKDYVTAIQHRANKVLKENGIEKEFTFEEGRKYYYGYIERTVKDEKVLKMLKNNM